MCYHPVPMMAGGVTTFCQIPACLHLSSAYPNQAQRRQSSPTAKTTRTQGGASCRLCTASAGARGETDGWAVRRCCWTRRCAASPGAQCPTCLLWSWCADKTQRPTRRRLLQRSRLDDRRSAAGKYTRRRPSRGRLSVLVLLALDRDEHTASSRDASPAVCY